MSKKESQPVEPQEKGKPAQMEENRQGEPQRKDSLAGLSESMLRLQAEFDNYKKRTAKEKESLVAHSEAKLLLRMIPVYEELKIAEKETEKISDESIRKGVQLVLLKLRASFEKEGLQEMKLEGEKFDPFRHDCALKEESGAPEGTIVKVIQKGYLFRGDVLRHALVTVSGGKKKEESKGDEEKADGKGAASGNEQTE